MSKSKPFPAITGSCVCNTIRYRLLTSPLYCYACHCGDCQKSTGSAFGLFLNIEWYNIRIISPTRPAVVSLEKKPGIMDRHIECPQCKTELWGNHTLGDVICDIKVGTLDFPSLMEPDLHIFVESKLDWVQLPADAKTAWRDHDFKETWPKSSLKRLELCMQTYEKVKKKAQAAIERPKDETASGDEIAVEETSAEGEKTPTAVEFGNKDLEDDQAFEQRFKETEKALQERLEKLSLKLAEEVTKEMENTTI